MKYDNIFINQSGNLYGWDPEGKGGMLIYKFPFLPVRGIHGLRIGFVVHTSKYMQAEDYGEDGSLPENINRPTRQILPIIPEPQEEDKQKIGIEIFLDEELIPSTQQRYEIKPDVFGQQKYVDIVLEAYCSSIAVKFIILNDNPRFMEWNYLAVIPKE